MQPYDHTKIESKWQKKWAEDKADAAKDPTPNSKKFYSLIEFPYPSGDGLHVGHPRPYIGMDVISRKRRMQGYNVLYPIGWDAFGLPTENYAIKTGKDPREVTKQNSDTFRRQIQSLAVSFDWSREINTTDPKYYKWTQWIFLQFLKAGLAYKKKMTINWCPKDLIGLANEEVIDGKCERCGTPVEKREKEQWMLAITKYADKLLAGLDAIEYEEPKFVDHVNPPRPGKRVVERNNVHAIVFDPKNKKFLIMRNSKHNWDTVVMGGIEEGEDLVEAARREVREETGYTDIEFRRILGGSVEASYFAKHKDENRIAHARAVYFELKSDARVPITDDNGEGNEILWVDEADFVPGKMVNSELPVWLARLSVRVERDEKDPNVLQFTEIFGHSAFRPEMPTVERNPVAVIVKHWKEDKYIGLKWKKVAWKTIITGGPEGNQTPEEGAATEIIEETGYLNPKFVRKLGRVDAKFFHGPKNVNRLGHFDVLYFELKNGDRRDLTDEEKANHDLVWLDKEEMSAFLSPAAQKYIWDTMFLGKPSWFDEPRPLLDWPESIKESQRNWIGKSEGAEFDFKIAGAKDGGALTVFTTRPDTLFGVTYVVLAPEHPRVQAILSQIQNKREVEEYIARAKNQADVTRTDVKREKTGIELKGVKAVNPANNEEIPIWIADYVLADYGTGAVMAVPAHDERDFEFAQKYKLPVRQVIAGEFGNKRPNEIRRDGGCAIIFDPKTQKYAVYHHEVSNHLGFFGGGVDADEDIREGILREVSEESGLYDFEKVDILETADAHYYHSSKKLNRVAGAVCLFAILKSAATGPTHLEEHEKLRLVWVSAAEIEKDLKGWNQNGDNEHWQRFLYQAVARAIDLGYDKTSDKDHFKASAYIGEGRLIDSAQFSGMYSAEARPKIAAAFGTPKTTYKLRDWVFSRQRYWGEPIPVIHCEKCGIVPVAEKDLPVKLPPVKNYKPTETGESPLAAISEWVNVKCPKCKGKAKRETDTMPNWAGSSWYYLRYTDPKNSKEFAGPDKLKYWTPVDWYNGGNEHTTLHLLYSRFWHKFLFDQGLVPTSEPYKKRTSHGLILAKGGEKMSKSKGNVVNPDTIVKAVGADSLRLYEMFMGPFEQAIAWDENGIVGCRRFIEKVWKLAEKVNDTAPASAEADALVHKTIKKVSEDIEAMRFNTAVSALMIAVNELEKGDTAISRGNYSAILLLLAPFAPHVTEELWHKIHGAKAKSIHREPWPAFDPSKIAEATVRIAVQVNGKTRADFEMPAEEARHMDEQKAREKAVTLDGIKKWIYGKEITKVIYVKGRLINIVIASTDI